MYGMEQSVAPVNYSYATPNVDEEPIEAPNDAQSTFGNAFVAAQLANQKKDIPVAHDGWSKGDDGWKRDPSYKTPLTGKTKDRGEEYKDEKDDASAFRGEPSTWTKRLADPENSLCAKVSTRMMGEDEAKQHDVGVKDGKLVDGKGGLLDTGEASGIGTYGKGGKGRHIYASTPEGQMRAMDPWEQRQERDLVAPEPEEIEEESTESTGTVDPYAYGAQPVATEPEPVDEDIYAYGSGETVPEGPTKTAKELSLANHSTLLDGGKASGAGEIRADKGENVVLSDRSGHYKPDNAMTYDTSRRLTDQGLSPEALTVELTNKTDARPKPGLKNGDLQASALEFQSYGGHEGAESAMRGAREDRKPMMEQIASFDPSTLDHVQTDDRSAPRREKLSEQIANGDRPSLKNRASMFSKA